MDIGLIYPHNQIHKNTTNHQSLRQTGSLSDFFISLEAQLRVQTVEELYSKSVSLLLKNIGVWLTAWLRPPPQPW